MGRERYERKGEEVEKAARSRTDRKADVSLFHSRPGCL